MSWRSTAVRASAAVTPPRRTTIVNPSRAIPASSPSCARRTSVRCASSVRLRRNRSPPGPGSLPASSPRASDRRAAQRSAPRNSRHPSAAQSGAGAGPDASTDAAQRRSASASATVLATPVILRFYRDRAENLRPCPARASASRARWTSQAEDAHLGIPPWRKPGCVPPPSPRPRPASSCSLGSAWPSRAARISLSRPRRTDRAGPPSQT